MTVVVDASAVLALFFDEAGADQVGASVRGALLSAVNLDEVLHKCVRRGIAAATVLAQLGRLEVIVRPFDAEQAAISASFHPRAQPAGLSFADRACAALGAATKATVLTADRDLSAFDAGIDIRLIR